MSRDNSALVEDIFNNADPLAARNYVSLVHATEDPKVLKEYFELRAKQKAKEVAGTGVVMSVTFDFGGAGLQLAAQTPLPSVEVVDADDLRPADPPALAEPEPDTEIDLGDIFGLTLAPDAAEARQ